jgi:2-hydroxychromene-2-carboxylate isomerase
VKPQLDFFFSVASTYTYLTVNRADEVAAREGVKLHWRPFNVRAIMIEQNNRPFVGKPVKMRYMWRDLERRAMRHGIAFKSIPPYPVDPDLLANRVSSLAAHEGWCPEYVRATYRDWFLEGKIAGEERNVRSVLAALGKDPEGTIARANGDENRSRFDAETDMARSLGIFGSPTFAWNGELFWGDDRLEEAIEWAKTHSA